MPYLALRASNKTTVGDRCSLIASEGWWYRGKFLVKMIEHEFLDLLPEI